jgi:hypothetical protein
MHRCASMRADRPHEFAARMRIRVISAQPVPNDLLPNASGGKRKASPLHHIHI